MILKFKQKQAYEIGQGLVSSDKWKRSRHIVLHLRGKMKKSKKKKRRVFSFPPLKARGGLFNLNHLVQATVVRSFPKRVKLTISKTIVFLPHKNIRGLHEYSRRIKIMSYEYCWFLKITVAETSFPKWRNLKISQPAAGENIFGKILSLRQVFSNLVSPPQVKNISGKIPSLSRVFGFPDEKKKKTVTETSFD